jgi:hypothetical protein
MLSDATATTSDPQDYGWGNGRAPPDPSTSFNTQSRSPASLARVIRIRLLTP